MDYQSFSEVVTVVRSWKSWSRRSRDVVPGTLSYD